MKKKSAPLKTLTYDNVKYICISDLINYLDNCALEFEKAKDDQGVKTLNELADVLSKA
ncbi:MAG: hypothetical protein WCH76_07200 [Candidatus Riflemargulisbacteria bacterium]